MCCHSWEHVSSLVGTNVDAITPLSLCHLNVEGLSVHYCALNFFTRFVEKNTALWHISQRECSLCIQIIVYLEENTHLKCQRGTCLFWCTFGPDNRQTISTSKTKGTSFITEQTKTSKALLRPCRTNQMTHSYSVSSLWSCFNKFGHKEHR